MDQPVDLAVDQLWKYQLRREHTALLEGLEDQQKKYAAFAEEAKAAHENLQEQIAKMKSKLIKLSEEGEKRAQEVKDQFRVVKEKSTVVEDLRNELKALGARLDSMEQPTNTKNITAPVMSAVKEIPEAPSGALAQVQSQKVVETTAGISLKAPVAGARRRSSRPSVAQKSTKRSQNVANTGFRKSRRQAHRDPSPIPAVAYIPLPEYPPDQDNMPLDMFVHRIDGISATVAPEHQRELAGMFITGLARRAEQDAMVEVLSNKLMARVYGDGRVEIYCDWKDMRKVLMGAGLISGVEEADVPKQRSRK